MMKLKLDENLPTEACELFKEAGHDAMTALEQNLGGHADELLFACCKSEERVLVTFDLDFADIRSYPPEESFGIIVLRLTQQDKFHLLQVIKKILLKLEDEKLTGKLWIVNEHSIRIRD